MKTKRLLAFLLIAVFVIGVMPLTVAADKVLVCGLEEHDHSNACYTLTCGKVEHKQHIGIGRPGSCYSKCTRDSNPSHWNRWGHKDGYSCIELYGNYYYLTCGLDLHTHKDSCYTLSCGKVEHKHNCRCYEDHYSYLVTVNYVFGSTTISSDTSRFGVIVGDETVGFTIIPGSPSSAYKLIAGTPESVSEIVSKDNLNPVITFYLKEVEGGEEENPTPIPEVTPTYIPPQVIIPTTPTPEPEIELPEEEIPTDVPEVEEEEQFEDEEIPTNVPTTGDASPIFPAIALIALAGAAFALTFKKSRKNG